MPSRCIFFFSALRAWSTLLSRTRTCTRAPLVAVRFAELHGGASVSARAAVARHVAEQRRKVHKPAGFGQDRRAPDAALPRRARPKCIGARARLAQRQVLQ